MIRGVSPCRPQQQVYSGREQAEVEGSDKVCVCVCVCVCMCMCACMCVCVCVCVHCCLQVCACVCLYVCGTWVHVCSVCVRIHKCKCMWVFVCVCTREYACLHAYVVHMCVNLCFGCGSVRVSVGMLVLPFLHQPSYHVADGTKGAVSWECVCVCV